MVVGMGESNSVEIEVTSAGTDEFGRNIQSAETALGGLRSTAVKAGAALTGLGVAGALAINNLIGRAREVNGAFREVTTLMGEGEDAALIFGDEVERLAAEFGAQGGEVEVISGLYQTLSAGVTDAADATLLMEQAMKLGTAGLTDTRTAVDALTTIINAYALDVDEAERASDVLFETVRKGKTTMDELAPSVGAAIPIAAELGVEIEEVGATLATLTAAGQGTDRAVTALRAAMTQLLKPTDTMQAVIESLGFSTGRALVEAEGFGGAIRALAGRADEAGVPLAEVFNNIRAMQAAFPIAGDSAEKYEENLRAMMEATGATNTAFEIMSASLGFRLTQSTNRVNAALANLGGTFLTALRPSIEGALDAVDRVVALFNSTDESTRQLIASTVIAATKWSLLAGSFLLAVSAASVVVPAIIGILGPLALVAGAVATLGTVWSRNMFGIQEKTAETLDTVRSTVRSGLQRVTGLWSENRSDVATTVDAGLTAVEDRMGRAFSFINSNLVRPGLAEASRLWDIHGSAIQTEVRDTYNAVVAHVNEQLNVLNQTVIQPILSTVMTAWNRFGNEITFVTEKFTQVALFIITGWLGRVWALWSSNFGNIRGTTTEILGQIVTTIFTGLETIRRFWEANGETIIARVNETWTRVRDTVDRFLTFVNQNIVQPALRELTLLWESHAGELVAETVETFSFIADRVMFWLNVLNENVVQPILERVGAVWDVWGEDIMNVVAFVFNTIITVVGGALDLLLSTFRVALALLRGDWEGAWDIMAGFFERTAGRIIGIMRGLKDVLLGIVSTLINRIIGRFEALFNRLVGNSIVVDLKNRVVGLFGDMKSGALRKVSGIVNGVKSVIRRANDAVTALKNIPKNVTTTITRRIKTIRQTVTETLGLQAGGVVTSPGTFVVGEGRESEAVLPLSHLEGMLREVARESRGAARGRGGPVVAGDVVIHADTREGGERAADAFLSELKSAGFRRP